VQLSLDWVSDFVDISDIDPKNLAELLTERVAEVEYMHTTGCNIPLVVVGEILKIEPIEGADKIQLTTVNIGSEELKIICGAKNIHEGAKVPVAVVGCVLPENFKIEKRKMKGVESNGMICSEAELGLVEKSEGIMLLDPATEVGKSFSEVCGNSTVLEIDNHAITHRADLFSHLGFAREISVLFNTELKTYNSEFRTQNIELLKSDKKIDVEVAEPKLCARYSALKISSVKVQNSSQKIQKRLESCGVRAINNVVDATNYVLLELGQPMHAFNAKKLAGGWLIVRNAKQGEQLKTLDGTDLKLSAENLVIADAEKPVALAGVMGGANSEVDAETTEIVLEAANFDAISVRRTSLEFGLRSESSLRFEKRIDPNLPPEAIARFVEVLRETCPELRIEAAADVKNFEIKKRVIELSLVALAQKLGAKVDSEKAVEILRKLGFKVEQKTELELSVEVPSFRAGRDIQQPIDLMEEVIRHIGYQALPSDFPRVQMEALQIDLADQLQTEIEDAMVGFGFHEVATIALVPAKILQKANRQIERVGKLQNPPSEDYRYLRDSLLASLLDAAAKNVRHQKDFRLFEVSTVFEKATGDRDFFTALIIGESDSYLRIRGVLEKLLASLKFSAEFSESIEFVSTAHPGRSADVKIAGKKIGIVAELHPAVAKNFELPESAFFCLDFDLLARVFRGVVEVSDLPKFPGIPRDLAILVSQRTLVCEVENAISTADTRIHDLQLFDTYEGEGVPENMKSLAFSFEIRDSERTLEEKVGEEVVAKIVANLGRIGGELR
jgi:phenylalanyl-tRNA synthetase beta chain